MPTTGTLSPLLADGIFRCSISRGCCVPFEDAAPAAPLLKAMAIVPRKCLRFMCRQVLRSGGWSGSRAVDTGPVLAEHRDLLGELLEVDRLDDIAVRVRCIAAQHVRFLIRGRHDDHGS